MESRCIGGRGQIAVTMLCATRVTVRDSSVKNILPLSTRLYSERQVLLRIYIPAIAIGAVMVEGDGGHVTAGARAVPGRDEHLLASKT